MFTGQSEKLYSELKAMLRRTLNLNLDITQVYYTDMCCEEQRTFNKILSELQNEGYDMSRFPVLHAGSDVLGVTDPSTLPLLEFPVTNESPKKALKSLSEISAACTYIRELAGLQANGRVIGLDAEWCTEGKWRDAPPAVVQLALKSGHAFVFQLYNDAVSKDPAELSMPMSLANLLEDSQFNFVGLRIDQDVSRINRCEFAFYDDCIS
jgi:hypothetical protein